jgi:RNA polymerase sigma-70 factor (ECF subfamily)
VKSETCLDAELLARVRAGDPDALGLLYDRHAARLFAFFARLTGRRDASEDLVQDTFLRILKYRSSFRGERGFVVWMYRIARNVFADYCSSRRTGDVPLVDEHEAPGSTPFERVERDEEIALLRRALGALPADRREVIVLCRYEGLSHEEVAALVGCSVGALKVRLHRALAELRDAYCTHPGGRR